MSRWLIISFVVISLFLSFSLNAKAERTFEEEFELSLQAGKNQISDEEKQSLLSENHVILMQVADSNTFKILELFANLPSEKHEELKEKTYLKWQFSSLDQYRQKVYEDIVQLNIEMAKQQGLQPQPGFSLEELKEAEVGFAIVDIPSGSQKTVSWYILWPKLSAPTWVTVVNGRLAGTPEYFQAHMQRLPALKTMPLTEIPKEH